MRIVYLSPSEPFPGTHAGFTHVYNLLRNLCDGGVEVDLVAGEPQPGMDPLPERERLTIHPVPPSDPLLRNARALRTVLSIIRKGGIDLIHERLEMAGGAGTVASFITGTPLVLEVNDPFMELNAAPWQRPPLRLLHRVQYRTSRAIICQTPLIGKVIRDRAGVVVADIHVIPNGADPSLFPPSPLPSSPLPSPPLPSSPLPSSPLPSSPLPSSLFTTGADGDGKRIGFMGSFMPWHGVRVLLRAFADIHREEPESGLLLIGNHLQRRAEITERVRELGIERWVEFTGPVPPERVPGLLASCRVLVAPFAPELDRDRRDKYERYGFWWSPLKIFEYMAAGRPVVATGLGMIPDYVGDAGLIYGPGDLEELTRHVLTLLRDGDLARTMGERGRRRIAETYNWHAVARATAGVYRRVTGGDPGSSGSPRFREDRDHSGVRFP